MGDSNIDISKSLVYISGKFIFTSLFVSIVCSVVIPKYWESFNSEITVSVFC